MENQEITSEYYKKAVVGIDESLLQDMNQWYDYVINLPEKLQVAYTVILFHQQVYNGGFHQYFFNSYGQFGYLTLENLRLIKANKAADLLSKALDQVNDKGYSNYEFRDNIFNRRLETIANFDERLSDSLSRLDDEYYSLDEDLEQLLVKYFKK